MNTILEQDIESDIIERQELLLQAKTLPFRYNFSTIDEQFFLNYSFPIIYSIWEGFVQTTFQTYIREINRLNLTYDTLCDQLLVKHMEYTFKQLKEYPDRLNKKLNFFDSLKSFFATGNIYIVPFVDTESNVGFNVLNKILLNFNIETISEYYRPRYSLKDELDKFLLRIRNDVAHGQNSVIVDRSDVIRAIDLVELLMTLVFNKIKESYFSKKSHLKNQAFFAV